VFWRGVGDHENERLKFLLMANCDGSTVRMLLRLGGGDKQRTAPYKKGDLRITKLRVIESTVMIEDKEVAEAYKKENADYYDNELAGEANRLRFCLYRRRGDGRDLTLVHYEDRMKFPTLQVK
jgi:hypothetical protein